jgi:hypothetical protein
MLRRPPNARVGLELDVAGFKALLRRLLDLPDC